MRDVSSKAECVLDSTRARSLSKPIDLHSTCTPRSIAQAEARPSSGGPSHS